MFFALQALFKSSLNAAIPDSLGGFTPAVQPAQEAPDQAEAATGAEAEARQNARARTEAEAAPRGPNPDTLKLFAQVYGLMTKDQVSPPKVTVTPLPPPLDDFNVGEFAEGFTVRTDPSDPQMPAFTRAFYTAIGEAKATPGLLAIVYPILVKAGTDLARNQSINATELAGVIRNLAQRGVDATKPQQFERLVNEALDTLQNVGNGQEPSAIGIDLPDLNTVTDNAIVKTNIMGLQPVYFSAMFEEMKVFQVVDRLVELFQNGVLPIGLGSAGNYLYKYWKEAPNRISEAERRNFYARAFGIPGGDDAGMPNREFSDLWLRFISAVSYYIRQNQLDNLLRADVPGSVTQQQVRKSGRDLAANLSLHGYGMTYFAATDLQKQIKDVISLLSDPDIRQAYGARDMWQVIDQVTMLDLGGAGNTVRYRTMATAGATIMAWLATRAARLSDSSFEPILDMNAIRFAAPSNGRQKPMVDPTDADLVNACEQYLAVTGTEEGQVEQFSQPRISPNTTSRPIQIPAVARDVLDAAGVSLGLGMPGDRDRANGHANGQANGHASARR